MRESRESGKDPDCVSNRRAPPIWYAENSGNLYVSKTTLKREGYSYRDKLFILSNSSRMKSKRSTLHILTNDTHHIFLPMIYYLQWLFSTFNLTLSTSIDFFTDMTVCIRPLLPCFVMPSDGRSSFPLMFSFLAHQRCFYSSVCECESVNAP